MQEKTGRDVEMMVEEMDAKQARLFSLLDLGKFMLLSWGNQWQDGLCFDRSYVNWVGG